MVEWDGLRSGAKVAFADRGKAAVVLPNNHADAEQVRRLVPDGRRVHLRGQHYLLVAAGEGRRSRAP
jgi:hypothetical protein